MSIVSTLLSIAAVVIVGWNLREIYYLLKAVWLFKKGEKHE